MTQNSALCFSPSRSTTAGTQESQGTTAQADSNSPPLEETTVGVRVIVVLSFLQEMLDKQRSSSTIKVYVAAIATFHAPIAG